MIAASASDHPLLAIFAGEAGAHVRQLEAALVLLDGAGAPAALASMLETLHTLGGAARAVDLRELEWLCQALERALGAAADNDATLARDQRDLLAEAVALAGTLLPGVVAASRGKRPLTLVAQLDALARTLAAPASLPAQCANGNL
jgi:two-component system chemotaxis sensor kinase CheA